MQTFYDINGLHDMDIIFARDRFVTTDSTSIWTKDVSTGRLGICKLQEWCRRLVTDEATISSITLSRMDFHWSHHRMDCLTLDGVARQVPPCHLLRSEVFRRTTYSNTAGEWISSKSRSSKSRTQLPGRELEAADDDEDWIAPSRLEADEPSTDVEWHNSKDGEQAALLVDDLDEPVDVLGAELAKIMEHECMRLAETRRAEGEQEALESAFREDEMAFSEMTRCLMTIAMSLLTRCLMTIAMQHLSMHGRTYASEILRR